MDNLIALTVNPGKLYYNYDYNKVHLLVNSWDDKILKDNDDLLCVNDKYRINVTKYGEISVYIYTENITKDELINTILSVLPRITELSKIIDEKSLTATIHLFLAIKEYINGFSEKKDTLDIIKEKMQLKFGKCFSMCSMNYKNNDFFGDITAKTNCSYC